MSETATALLAELLALSEADRRLIADRLWDSLSDQTVAESIDDSTADPDFQTELERRIDEIDAHPERLIDGESVMAELRARTAGKREP